MARKWEAGQGRGATEWLAALQKKKLKSSAKQQKKGLRQRKNWPQDQQQARPLLLRFGEGRWRRERSKWLEK
jgi:hypothetical protein